jgi:ribulose-phosphate 3-epimerase
MENKFMIGASLICGNQADLKGDIELLKKSEMVDFLHVDTMDGLFVPRYGMYPEQVKHIKEICDIPVNVHMMVSNPEPFIDWFAESGADIITVHVEPNQQLGRTITMIKKAGCKVGLAFNIHSTHHVIESFIDDISLVMLMAINPGILGQGCWPGIYKKIKTFRNYLDSNGRKDVIIEIDGGVTPETAPKLVKAGANMLTCGTGTIYRPKEAPLDIKIGQFKNQVNRELEYAI